MNAFLSALAWSLLDFVWQGLLIGWIGALALGLLRRARPQARYAVACAALLLCAALPLASMLQHLHSPAPRSAALAVLSAAPADTLISARAPDGAATGTGLALVERLSSWEGALQERLPMVVLLWSVGAGLLALRMVAGLLWVQGRTQFGSYTQDPLWQQRLNRLAAQFQLPRHVRLGISTAVHSPVTAGWWRPIVLVPASLLSGMPPDLLEALLAHELAHIKRYDYLVNLIQSAIEIVLFYHPTVWWLSGRIRIEREQIADDLAASMLGEPRRLALALSELDLFQFSTPQLAPGAHGGNLMSRIKRLVRPGAEPLNWKLAVPILGLSAACLMLFAQAQASTAASAPAPLSMPASVAAPDAPDTPAPAEKPAKAKRAERQRGDAFALVQSKEKGDTMHGSSADMREVKDLKKTIQGDFLWFREGGKSYVVRDPATVAKVAAAWEPMNKLGAEMDVYGKQMESHGAVMEKLGEKMGEAGRAGNPQQGEMRKLQKEMQAIARQEREASREVRLATRKARTGSEAERAKAEAEAEALEKALEVKLEPLHRQMEDLGKQMELEGEKMAKMHAPMEALGKQMEEASKPMNALGKQMEVLGKQMELKAKDAEKTTRSIIAESMKNSLATPVQQ